jgi:H+/Cl- antiporter ClcA
MFVEGRAPSPAPERSEWHLEEIMKNKPNYVGWGLSLGAAIGVAVGVMAGNIGVWLALGIAIGMLLGAAFRKKETTCPECAQVHREHATKTELEARS